MSLGSLASNKKVRADPTSPPTASFRGLLTVMLLATCHKIYPLRDITGGCSTPLPCVRTGLCVCEPPRDRGGPACLRHESPWGVSLRTTVPLLAQEVFELVHELLRVEGVVTIKTQRLVPRRVIDLL